MWLLTTALMTKHHTFAFAAVCACQITWMPEFAVLSLGTLHMMRLACCLYTSVASDMHVSYFGHCAWHGMMSDALCHVTMSASCPEWFPGDMTRLDSDLSAHVSSAVGLSAAVFHNQ